MAININSEEDVKIKIVIPFLEELGFIKEELDFETNFHLKFGKNIIPVGATKSIDSANARLDILVKYQEKNICVFEIKKDTIKISEDDIKQAVSYSSLIRPMAPFCIVSNGKEFILVDTISGEPFKKEDIERYEVNGYKITLPEETYYERIKHFLGYSKENLMKFCEEQVSQYIKPLKGSKEDRNKKYIKEIYEPSEILTKALEEFRCQNEYASFVLVAKSGMGKTCWACHTAETLLESGIPVLFYSAGDIKRGIFEAITDDLKWSLSPQFDVIQGMKRFFDIFENETVYIIIDGLDEIEINTAHELTEDFFRRIKNRDVKFITTCKPEIWRSLLVKNDIPSQISEATINKDYLLNELEINQFHKIVDKYRSFFEYRGLFQSEVLDDCKRNLYLLRIMFEVASSEKAENITYTFSGFFKQYYTRIINRFDIAKRESIKIMLDSIGKLLYQHNSDYIDIRKVRESLNLGALETMPQCLFDLNILDKREDEHAEEIGFYFQRFRDYIIAFRVLQWQNLTPQQFKKEVEVRLGISGVRLNVLELYYILANEENKRILDQPLYNKAEEYVTFYENLLNSYFPSIKKAFAPHTQGKIGLVGYFDISIPAILMYGFRRISEPDSIVLLIPSSGIDAQKDNNLAYLYGVQKGMHMRFPSSFTDNMSVAEDVINNEIPKELKNLLDTGKLNESKSITLIHEKLFAAGYSFYPDFIDVNPRFSGIMIKQFPLAKLKEGILSKRAFRILEDELLETKLKNGEIKVNRQGDFISYSYRTTEDEKKIIGEKAIEISQEGIFYPSKIRYSDDDFEEEILKDIKYFESIGITEVCDPIAIRSEELQKFNELYWCNQPDIKYAETFFSELLKTGLIEYRALVDNNFSLFKEIFKTYKDIPLTFFISVLPSENRAYRHLTYIEEICKPLDNVDYEYSVIVKPYEWNDNDRKKVHDGKEYEIINWSRGDFAKFLTPSTNFCSFKSKGYLLCIRSLVYGMIAKDFKQIINKIAELYGVKLKAEFKMNDNSKYNL